MAGAGAASAAGRGARGGFEWPAGRRWALSLSWDGGAYANFRGAAPALEACGVRGTFYIVGDMCEVRALHEAGRQGRLPRARGIPISAHPPLTGRVLPRAGACARFGEGRGCGACCRRCASGVTDI